jgi:hypothetical protein
MINNLKQGNNSGKYVGNKKGREKHREKEWKKAKAAFMKRFFLN